MREIGTIPGYDWDVKSYLYKGNIQDKDLIPIAPMQDIETYYYKGEIRVQNKTETISPEFAKALVAATSNIQGAIKDSNNPYFKTKYADLNSVIEAIRKPLADQGITFLQRVHEGTTPKLETILVYSSGEILSMGVLALPTEKLTPQAFGSALTYCRRYSLATALGVAAHDDDGNEAEKGDVITKKAVYNEGSPKAEHIYYHIPNIDQDQVDWLEEHQAYYDIGLSCWVSNTDFGEKLAKYRVQRTGVPPMR